jgi:anti-sigma regulatory factor (Ser/Thr protein kinase)
MVIESSRFHSRLDLALQPSAARWARLHARDVFTTWQIPPTAADDALLVACELVTNAVRHASPLPVLMSPGARPPVRTCALTLQRMPDHLLICVYDQDRRPPVLKEASEDGESGRGLHLVDELSATWGYAYPNPSVGKVVWAKVATDDGAEREAPGARDHGQRALPLAQPWIWRHRVKAESFRVGAAMSA